jgi:hypothetical protein
MISVFQKISVWGPNGHHWHGPNASNIYRPANAPVATIESSAAAPPDIRTMQRDELGSVDIHFSQRMAERSATNAI